MNQERNPITEMRLLRETAHKLSETLDVSKVVQLLLHQTVFALEAQGALVRLLSPDGQELLLVGSTGLSEEYLHKGPVRLFESNVDLTALGDEVVILEDVTHDPDFQYPEAAAQEGLRGMLTIPLLVRERTMGVLRVYLKEVKTLTESKILMLRTLADMCALAMEKIRLHQSLYRISEALNSSLELPTMLQHVLEATVREMELKAASIRLLDEKGKTLSLVAAHGLSEAYLAKGEVNVAKSPVDQRVLRGEVVVLYDVENEHGFQYPEEAAHEGIRSVLVAPLRLKDRTLGVMRVYSARPRHFSDVAANFLTSVTNLVGLGIVNAELYAALQARYEDLKLDLADWYRFLALG